MAKGIASEEPVSAPVLAQAIQYFVEPHPCVPRSEMRSRDAQPGQSHFGDPESLAEVPGSQEPLAACKWFSWLLYITEFKQTQVGLHEV